MDEKIKAVCIIGHEVPTGVPGRFDKYVAGKEYEVDEMTPYFRPVEGKPENKPPSRGGRNKGGGTK